MLSMELKHTFFLLIYVDETKGSLKKRITGNRFQINNGGHQLLYKHFHFPDYSVLSIKEFRKKIPL